MGIKHGVCNCYALHVLWLHPGVCSKLHATVSNQWVPVVSVLQAAATNAALQALKQAKLTAEQEAEAAAKQAELQAAAGDPWLNEDPQQAASSLSPVRVSCS